MEFSGSWRFTSLGMSSYQNKLNSSNSGGTVIFLKNILRTQSSANGWNIREVNIKCWRAVGVTSSVMRGYTNRKNLYLNGIVKNYLTLGITYNELFSGLLEFKQQWGHCGVPQKYAKSPKLVWWVRYMISQYRLLKSGRESFISDESIAKL